jgi:hypothetical protein
MPQPHHIASAQMPRVLPASGTQQPVGQSAFCMQIG